MKPADLVALGPTEQIAGMFEIMCYDYCLYVECGRCPLEAVRGEGFSSCQEAFADILRRSKAEPWAGHAQRITYSGKERRYCSLCGAELLSDTRCETCGAAIG